MKTSRWLGVLLGALGAVNAFADGFISVRHAPDDEPHLRRVLPPGHPIFAPLSVAYHDVSVKIEDQVAFTAIDQEFVNPTSRRLEGTYIFPLPPGAQIERFTMFIDGKETEAELLPADKARAIYEDIVRRSMDPALMEYAGRDVFKVRIFPIEPNGRKRIKISYRQILKADGDTVEYVYPLNTERFSSAPIDRVSVKVDIQSTIPLRHVYSPSHPVTVHRDGDRKAAASFEEKGTRPAEDLHLCFAREAGPLASSLFTYRPDPKEDGYFLLLASPGSSLEAGEEAEKDVVFVLDTSGSMAGPKMEQAKRALSFCVASLNDQDRFEIVRFSTEAEPMAGKLQLASPEAREAARRYIAGLKPIGGTAIDDALQQALALRETGSTRPFHVIFLTDGQPTVGETKEDEIVARVRKANSAATRVFCFGIGVDLNTRLLDRVTEETHAASQYVLPEEDIEVKVSSFYGRIRSPVLTGVQLGWPEGIRATKAYPTNLPDLFKGDHLAVFGRYSGSGPAAISLAGTLRGEAKRFVVEGTFPAQAEDRPWVARLWAARRVGFLLDEIRLRGESQELKDEVVALAKAHGIVTPYTSYLILESEDALVRGGALPPGLRMLQGLEKDAGGKGRVQRQYQAMRSEVSGRDAVEGRNANASLKEQAQLGGEGLADAELAKAPPGAPKPGGGDGRAVRLVGRKAFYQGPSGWIDQEIQRKKDAKRQQVKFGSEEYFQLARQSKEAAQWLSIGRSLQVAVGDTVYEITE